MLMSRNLSQGARGGAVPPKTYDLYTDIGLGTPATLTNGQVLDTAAEGVTTGELTVSVGAGEVELTSGAEYRLKSNAGTWYSAEVHSLQFSTFDGRAFFADIIPTKSGSQTNRVYSMVAVQESHPSSSAVLGYLYFRPSFAILPSGITETWAVGVPIKAAFVCDVTNGQIRSFIEVSGVWTLVYTATVTVPALLYFFATNISNNNNFPGNDSYVQRMRVPTDAITSVLSGSDFSELGDF